MKITFIVLLIIGLLSCKINAEKEEDRYISEVNEVSTSLVQNNQNDSYKRGKEIYNDFCITCHLSDGKGIPGNFPPLDGSNWLTEKRTESIHAVKYGLKGPITVNGVEYNGVMAPMGLTDREVADVMNYINNSWGNSIKKQVTVEEVAAVEK